MHTKIISYMAFLLIAIPIVAAAQTANQQTFIQQLINEAAKLQMQLNQLRRPASQIFPLPISSDPFEKLNAQPLRQSALSLPSSSPSPVENQEGDEGPSAIISFDRDLYFGMRNDTDVSNLQEFLTDQGFYSNTISGNFFLLTRSAVKKFQAAHGLKPTGYFGPFTRAVANKILAGKEQTEPSPQSHPASGSLSFDPASAKIAVGETIKIKAIFTPARPACLDSFPPCRVPEQLPYEVDVALVSSDTSIARTTCPPESGRLTCIGSNGVYGVSPGKAIVTATYTNPNNRKTSSAAMTVMVVANTYLYIEPSSAQLTVGQSVSIQALFQPPCPTDHSCIQSLQNVDGSFVSENSSVAAVDTIIPECPPPPDGIKSPCSLPLYSVRGVSPGDAVITASYTINQRTYTAYMKVTVTILKK